MKNLDLSYKLQLQLRGFIVIDNFLPAKVCHALRGAALGEEFVHTHYINGYKATDFDGLSRLKMDPDLIKFIEKRVPFLEKLNYHRAWSFVYDEQGPGVKPHADPSTYNVNLWVTPDECVYDKNKNGMIVYKKKAPENWTWDDYNSNDELIEKHLEGAKYAKIPYRNNRAIIFKGDTFHQTDSVHMKPGSINRRINYTFLFN